MSVFKVVARDPKTKRQSIKKIYETNDKFNKYGKETLKRYQAYHDVEVYELCDEQYTLLYELKMPRTKKEIEKYAEEMNYSCNWAIHRCKDLGL